MSEDRRRIRWEHQPGCQYEDHYSIPWREVVSGWEIRRMKKDRERPTYHPQLRDPKTGDWLADAGVCFSIKEAKARVEYRILVCMKERGDTT